MSKEKLEQLTVKQLMEICKQVGLPCYKGKSKLTKPQMIENILEYNKNSDEEIEIQFVGETPETTKKEESVVEEKNDVVEEKEYEPWELRNRDKYINEAEVGDLIAFIDNKGKPRTAALVNRSQSRGVIKVVTEFDWEFIVPYENVLWVRKGKRWPTGVYNLLKGYNKNVKTEDR